MVQREIDQGYGNKMKIHYTSSAFGKIFDDFEWQNYQGHCPNCGYRFIDYSSKFRNENKKEDFEFCLGFSDRSLASEINQFSAVVRLTSDEKNYEQILIGFECPECFCKSVFHCPRYWAKNKEYGKWIVYWLDKKEVK